MEEEIKKEIIGKAGFPLYVDYWEKYFSQMSGEQVKECLKIIFHFNTTFEVLRSDDLAINMVVITIIDNLKRDAQKRIKQSKASRGNGLLGGRPRKDEAKPKQTRSKTEGNVNENVECKSKLKMKITIPKPKGFTPPTLEEVKKYCIESNRSVDAKKFFDYYDTGNWIDGKGQAVKNWKQKLITWEGKNETPIQNNQKSCTPINKLIGKELISKIEVDGKTAKLHFKTENDYQALINLDQSLRDKIKAELTKEFGATKFEFKF